MNRVRIAALVVLVAALAGAGAWYANSHAPHRHRLERRTDVQGAVYYTCPMHPQVRRGEPGTCPICGMTLVQKHEAPGSDRRVLYYYDPMKPDVHFDAPGPSPFMDMPLVPKYAEDSAAADDGIRIDPRVIQNLGVRTARVERGSFSQRIEAVGGVEVDERQIVAVETRAPGWVEQLSVRAVGEPVQRGQRIAGIYSPDLFAAQQELVLAARANDPALLSGARQRLLLLGLDPAQIDQIAARGVAQRQVAVIAPRSGIVTELGVREGQQVTPGTPLLRIADLSRIWISVEIPEARAGGIVEGLAAQARVSALPGRTFEGRVEYVYPQIETQTRTLRARLSFDNPDLALKPGMYAEVLLSGAARDGALQVPTEAVIRTGERSVVILAEPDGRFRPAHVTVGEDHAGMTEILHGLSEGESIVVSGQFLIDSEAQLRSVLGRMEPPRSEPTEARP